MTNKTAIFVIGLPGAGKSTLTNLIKNDGFEVVSSSTLLDNVSKKQRDNLKEKYVNKGIDIPDDIYVKLIVNYIVNSKQQLFIIEGFSYNSNQRVLADNFFAKNNIQVSKVIYLNISKELAIDRIIHRRICPNCYKSFANNEIICDICGKHTIVREDDKIPIAVERIENLTLFLDEIVNYYRHKGILIEFDLNNKNIEELLRNSQHLKK